MILKKIVGFLTIMLVLIFVLTGCQDEKTENVTLTQSTNTSTSNESTKSSKEESKVSVDYALAAQKQMAAPVAGETVAIFHIKNYGDVKVKFFDQVAPKAVENFVDRYDNIAIAGLNYSKFCKESDKTPAFVMNTRIYSFLLIRNDIPYRWRGRYNEDTDLSLRVLKDGWCTIQFNSFLAGKATTQKNLKVCLAQNFDQNKCM